MEAFFLSHEREIYSVSFFAVLTMVALWEGVRPLRSLSQPLKLRWFGNFGIFLINMILIPLCFPMAALALSVFIARHGLGILSILHIPAWLAIVFGILSIDLGRWLGHYLLHRVPALWRLHRIHHADHDYDFTVGLRFHPFEALLTTGFILLIIVLFGPPPIAVLIAEILTLVSGLLVHANGRVPSWFECYLRLVFVTPEMHRIHHSIVYKEHNSNYSAVFSIWDRLLGTYISTPAAGQTGMTIGLLGLRDPRCLSLSWMLFSPFSTSLFDPVRRIASIFARNRR